MCLVLFDGFTAPFSLLLLRPSSTLQAVDMSSNSSPPSNPALSELFDGSNSTACLSIIMGFHVIKIFGLLPLYILVLYLCHQPWRHRRSFQPMSHADVFTYHLAVMELLWPLGTIFYYCGLLSNIPEMKRWSNFVFSIVFYGEGLFHLLTCVERFLAVVCPITYLGLKNMRGVRIRNISIGCVWLVCVLLSSLTNLFSSEALVILYSFLTFLSIPISFCSLSVLCVLIRPGPGEGDRDKRVVQSKQRAFFTITAIMLMLWLWFVGIVFSTILANSHLLSNSDSCVLYISGLWFNLPSSLILPLLYLQRTTKLSRCRFNRE